MTLINDDRSVCIFDSETGFFFPISAVGPKDAQFKQNQQLRQADILLRENRGRDDINQSSVRNTDQDRFAHESRLSKGIRDVTVLELGRENTHRNHELSKNSGAGLSILVLPNTNPKSIVVSAVS